jgi:hypothetical protein
MSDRADPHADAREWYCPTCDRSFAGGVVHCPDDGTQLIGVVDSDPLLGRTIDDRFVVRARLGQGGMGVVYRAWQSSVGREVAIKVIRPRPGHDTATAKRFLREAKLASALSHPATVGVIDFGQSSDGLLYLVMELLRGQTLADLLRQRGRLESHRAVRIATQICDALEAAHRLGIIHRDLKPANVMVLAEPPGRDLVKVLDFGLAKVVDDDASTVTQSGRMVGTPSHLSPEVVLGEPATPRSDLYAVGVLLYEMLDGRLPFAADNVNLMVTMHAYEPPPPLGVHVPRPLARLVARLLAKRPESRPSATELREQLEAMRPGVADDPLALAAETAPVGATAEAGQAALALAATFPKPKTRPPLLEVPSAAVAVGLASTSAGAALAERPSSPSASSPGAVAATAPSVPAPPRRRGWVVAAVAVVVAMAVVAVAFLRGDRRAGARATEAPGGGAVAADAPAAAALDAAALDAAPVDAGPLDAGPLDAGPLDAAPADAGPLDAGRGRRQRVTAPDRGPPPVDASASRPPPDAAVARPPVDARHPWD